MENKRLLRFYFTAETLDRTLNNLITKKAISSAQYGINPEVIGQQMCDLIQVKQELSELWAYLNSILSKFTEEELSILRMFGTKCLRIDHLTPELRRAINRTNMKFIRHAKHLDKYEYSVQILNRYYGLF